MVSGSKVESGTLIVSASVRKTIQSIKEIVEHHSDAEIYVSLKENNMDPSETIQKLLNQEPFHEVRRRRDKKKEMPQNVRYKSMTEPRKPIEHAAQQLNFNSSDHGVRRGGQRNPVAGASREFRVVRDNRTIQNVNGEVKPPSHQCSTSTSEQMSADADFRRSTGTSNNQKSAGEKTSSQVRPRDSIPSGATGKYIPVEKGAPVHTAVTQVQANKPNASQPHPGKVASNPSVVGVYSSSSDPVHVPSPDSRSAATVGAIRRDLGAVGVRRQSSENPVKTSSAQSSSVSNSHLGKDSSSSRETFRPSAAPSKGDQPFVPESVVSNRSFLSNQYNSRQHQQVIAHQKASQPNKEWKPKSREKRNPAGPGVIGTPTKPISHRADHHKESETDAAKVQDKLSRVSNHENCNVIIAEHIRVAESDRRKLTFGSFGAEFDLTRNLSETPAVGDAELSSSLSVSAPESPSDENSASKHANLLDDHARNSGSTSPAQGEVSEQQLAEIEESSSPQNLDGYAEVGLVRDDSQSYTPAELQQQEPSALPSFSAYDAQTGYDLTYFRPAMDETIRSQGLPSHYEVLSSQAANSIPATTVALGQQQHQQQQMSQMYPPQVHVSHYANLMPYRQFISPVYVPPPMAMPGFSSNPSYPHPSNGNSYLLMPGGSSHIGANNLKYGIQQFKPIPAGSPTGFGNFTNPTGYAINTPGVVGGAAGIEESSRLKYKDGNFYMPSQAETPEMWIQTPRELPAMQSPSYYNMPGPTPHAAAAAYMPSHTGHASFNAAAAAAAAAQSSHMQQFPGLYHPPQPPPIASPHHMGPAMGGNVGVGMAAGGAAPGTQVGAYQQPQMSHLNWPANF